MDYITATIRHPQIVPGFTKTTINTITTVAGDQKLIAAKYQR